MELPPPPHVWISWAVLFLYTAVAIEGAIVFYNYPWLTAISIENYSAGPVAFASVQSGQIHLCCVYLIETLLAVGPGWCAMSPGWTQFELFIHHVPYVAAVALAFFGGHAERWTAPMTMVLMTPLNEGMFIAQSLGAPEWIAKLRRAFGFGAICLLWLCETWTFQRNLVIHYYIGWSAMPNVLADAVSLGGIYYHLVLLRLYVRRWMKTRNP